MNYPSLTEVPNRFESKIAPARPFVNMEKPKEFNDLVIGFLSGKP